MLKHHCSISLFILSLGLGGVVVFGLLLAGCATPTPTATPTVAPPTSTASPTATPTPVFPAGLPTPGPDQTVHITDHFVIYYTAEISPAQVISVAHYLEAAWRDIPPFLGIEPPSRPIRVYLVLQIRTGVLGSASPTGVILIKKSDLLVNDDYSVVPHEFTHVLTGYSGPRWMEEGLAMYMQEQFPAGRYAGIDSISVDSWSIGLLASNRWVTLWNFPIGSLDRTSMANAFEEERAYWESGSFVKYLIETYGIDAFRKMHDDTSGWMAAEKVYGKPIDALVEEWRQHLANSTIPSQDCPECIMGFSDWTDIEIQFDQHKDDLSSSAREQVLQELKAVYEALNRKDAQAMRQHIEAARKLLEANINK